MLCQYKWCTCSDDGCQCDMVPHFPKWKVNSTLKALSKMWTLTMAVVFHWTLSTSIYPTSSELSSFVILRFCSEIFSKSFAYQCSVVYSFFCSSLLYIQPIIASWIFISIYCPLPFKNYSVPCVMPIIVHLFCTYLQILSWTLYF